MLNLILVLTMGPLHELVFCILLTIDCSFRILICHLPVNRFSFVIYNMIFIITVYYMHAYYRLLDSLVVECWHRVREVPGSIPSQGPHHTKDVMKMEPVVPLFSTQH